uniref:leucine-rich repeat and calponin homology domain-containing protein 2-like n=1 Tax=Styela clava TaxID=7725 RepID=UPI00193A794C|nr:leucine-rich repeat and calponin homology domain-containing protein 2-like [Styela clava]
MPIITMKSLSSNPPNTRSLDKLLEEAEFSGGVRLMHRRLKDIGQLVMKYDLANVTNVDLSHNRLSEVPLDIFEWQCVDALTITNNSIKTISEDIQELRLLETLDLSNNCLTVLPPQLCEIRGLTIIRLSCNKLISLPEEIGSLKKCQELDVSSNELTSIPSEIAKMENLLCLNIRKNSIFALPEEISTMKITHLDAGCNLITSIPMSFRNMVTLQKFVLDHNPLTSPPIPVLMKGRVHMLRELEIQAEKAQIKKDVMDDPLMSPMKRPSIPRADVNLLEMKARVMSITEEDNGREERFVEKAAELSKDRRKASVTNATSPEKKRPSPKKRVDKPGPRKQKSAENIPVSPPSQDTKPNHTLPKNVITKERKRSASSGNFERKSSTEALLIHQKLSGFPGYKPNIINEKTDMPSANGKTPATQQKLQEFVKNRQALSPTDRNNQVANNKTVNSKKGFLPSSIKPRTALNRMRGNSFNTGAEKDVSFTMRRKTEKLYEELEMIETLRQNIEARLKISLGDDLPSSLSDGVVLCHLTNHARPRSITSIHVPSPAVPKLTLAKRRRNIDNFLDACAKVGVPKIHICSAQDILLEKNIGKVGTTVNELLKLCPHPAPSPKRQVETPSVKVTPSTLTKQHSQV